MIRRRTHETGQNLTLLEELAAEVERPTFFARAACVGMNSDIFYPHPSQTTEEARAVCARCPVRADCLEWAIEHNEREGVWGGMSKDERIEHMRARGIDGTQRRQMSERRRRLAAIPQRHAMTPKELAKLMKVDERTMLRDLKWLREEGVA